MSQITLRDLDPNIENMIRKIPTNDIWIAAYTMELGAELITFDRHFENIKGLVYSIFN
jgi:predicted nucleic acid-binding protein